MLAAINRESLMREYKTVSEVTRELGVRFRVVVRPRVISDLFYGRMLDDARCPILCGRRMIPADYIPTIIAALRDRGLIPDQEAR